MFADKLQKGDTIGIVAPSHIGDPERYRRTVAVLESLGFRVKIGGNVFRNTYGYLASERERADDFNAMARDPAVKMVLFGGGEGGNELLPYLDFDAIAAQPKLYASFSDGTTILNAIYAKTGLVTYYGTMPGAFSDLRYYDWRQFEAHFLDAEVRVFERNYERHPVNPGVGEGLLIGGYTRNFALLQGSVYCRHDPLEKYILFLEDHEKFSDVAAVSAYISHIEQSPFIHTVAGLLFGHYAAPVNQELLGRFGRFAEKYGVPVVYCDDFGHGTSQGILPIGRRARLDGEHGELAFL